MVWFQASVHSESFELTICRTCQTFSLSIANKEVLVDPQELAFDGTIILANASKQKAMSYGRIYEKVQNLHQEMEELKTERKDAKARRQEEIECELNIRREQMAPIQEAKIALEDEHLELHGELPDDKTQRNFTDSESRIMKKGSSFEQCFNALAAVAKGSQIILAAYITQACNDNQQLETLVKCLSETVGMLPAVGLSDAGYFSEATVEKLKERFKDTEWLISPGRVSYANSESETPKSRIPCGVSTADRMRRKLSTKTGKKAYALRKTIVEPVFGQIKEANLESRRFSFRVLAKAQCEWLFVCAAHNILKVIRHRLDQQ